MKGIIFDVFVKSQKLTNLSFPRKRESSNYKQLWIPDQVGNDKTTEIRTSREVKSANVLQVFHIT